MLKVYHFANLGFGLPFLEHYDNFSKDLLSKIDVTVVFSTKQFYRRDARGFSYLKSKLRSTFWKIATKRKFAGKPLKFAFSRNVNHPHFIDSIRKDSVGICTGFNQIFSEDLISCFESCINVHPSVLPYYRGPAPSYWCLKNHEKKTGFTFHRMTQKIDAGEILYQDTLEINITDTEKLLDLKIAERAKNILYSYLKSLINKDPWKPKIINAPEIYLQKIDYLSFPK